MVVCSSSWLSNPRRKQAVFHRGLHDTGTNLPNISVSDPRRVHPSATPPLEPKIMQIVCCLLSFWFLLHVWYPNLDSFIWASFC